MAKWSGVIGYSTATEVKPGVWDYVITERKHVGDLVRNTRRSEGNERVVEDIKLNNSISIVSDAYSLQHFFEMRYLTLFGTMWVISTVEVLPPRLVLQIGGVYNGPTPTPSG